MPSLPKLDLPRYKHHLVGLDKKIYYRAFTTKEQKILLQAKEDGKEDQMIEAIKQIVENCTFNEFDVNDLPYFDLEDLFMQIRIRSVSDVVTLAYKVKNEYGSVKEKIEFDIDLKTVKVVSTESHTNKIQLTDKVGVKMVYPSIDMLHDIKSETELLEKCIDFVYDESEVYYLKDMPREEIDEFIDSLDVPALKKFKEFFDTMPRLRHEENVKLKDGSDIKIKLEGLKDFF